MLWKYACERLNQLPHAFFRDDASDIDDVLFLHRELRRARNAGVNDMNAREGIVDAVEKAAPDEIADADNGTGGLEQFSSFGDGTRSVHCARIIAEMQRNRNIAETTADHIDHHWTVVHFDKIGTMLSCKFAVSARHCLVTIAFPPARLRERLKANALKRVFYRRSEHRDAIAKAAHT